MWQVRVPIFCILGCSCSKEKKLMAFAPGEMPKFLAPKNEKIHLKFENLKSKHIGFG